MLINDYFFIDETSPADKSFVTTVPVDTTSNIDTHKSVQSWTSSHSHQTAFRPLPQLPKLYKSVQEHKKTQASGMTKIVC